MKKLFLLPILISLTLSFLFFQEGDWMYIDTSYIATTFARDIEYLYSSLSTYGISGFGFDNASINSTRYLQLFFTVFLGERGVYIIFFLLSFFSSFYLLKEFFSKNSSFYGALFFTFNPISLYFLSEIGFIFAYSSLPIIVYGFYFFIKKERIIYLIYLILGILFLFSYTRLIGLYGGFLIFLFFIYLKFGIQKILKNYKKLLLIFFSTCLILSPFFLSVIFPYISGDKDYFVGLGNYLDASSKYNEYFYNLSVSEDFFRALSISEILDNIYVVWSKNNIWYDLYGFLFIFIIFIFVLFKNSKYKNKYINLFIYLFIFIVTYRISAKIFTLDIFSLLVYGKYFPFVTGNLNWLYLIFIPILSVFIVFLLNKEDNKKISLFIKTLTFIFIGISIFPYLFFIGNTKLKLISNDIKPKNITTTFYNNKIERNGTLFFPSENLYFKWSPYQLELANNTIYKTIFINNTRLVNNKQSNIYTRLENGNLYDNYIFNLKNIFVFKDVKNAKEGQFDFFEIRDYEKESKEYYEKLKNDENLYIKNDNENFAHFGLKYDDKYEYFLYSPAKIEKFSIDDFFSDKNSINIFEKPINIDGDSFNKPDEKDIFQIPEENKNIAIRYKKSDLQPTKIYAKFGNIDTSKPFLVQLNQTFGMSWKLKFITKEEFEEKKCIDEYKEFEITQNKVCNYKAQILDLADTKFIDNPEVPSSQHFEGNFVGNAWLVKPENIPEGMKNSEELYAVIIYEKQIWYNWALLISGLTFIFLIILIIFQEIKNFKNRKYEK